ncbi:general stress protein [Labrys okinawensis]|uniref:general stress protein n=1 Tax=Labrys okinawensis TaxID=346911 RepID=UPI0015E2C480|nr:general stress protein [Labrys okinawensis]
MTRTVSALYDRYDDATRAVHALEDINIPGADISVVASNADNFYEDAVADDAVAGAGMGAAVGGVGGLLAGLGMLTIPGIGPAVAAGWLASTVLGATGGAVVGGAAGSLVGAMTDAGVAPADANVYAEGVRRGRTLVSATVPDEKSAETAETLRKGGALDIDELRTSYQAEGWTQFDIHAPPPTAESLRNYRNGTAP